MTTLSDSKTIGVSIARDWRDVYAFMSRPESFASWASGIGKPLGNDGTTWRFESADGNPVTVRFTAVNAYGVLDHHVVLADGTEIYIPMRVVANGDGADVLFTLFRVQGMSDDRFAADAQ